MSWLSVTKEKQKKSKPQITYFYQKNQTTLNSNDISKFISYDEIVGICVTNKKKEIIDTKKKRVIKQKSWFTMQFSKAKTNYHMQRIDWNKD